MTPWTLRTRAWPVIAAVLAARLWTPALLAAAPPQEQEAPAAAVAQAAAGLASLGSPAPSSAHATFSYNNRTIAVLRANFLQRTPAERVAGAVQQLDQIVAGGAAPQVTTRRFEGTIMVSVGPVPVFVLFPSDVDDLRGETLEGKADVAVTQLQVALNEAVELRTPARLIRSAIETLLATFALVGLVWAGRRLHARLSAWLATVTDRELERRRAGAIVRAARLPHLLRGIVSASELAFSLLLLYSWATFVLRRFPYTRPWGESLASQLVSGAGAIGLGILHTIPDLLIVALIAVIARAVVRFVQGVFNAAERGELTLPWLYPETAAPTKRIVIAIVWIFALILAYPYLPGSETDAFRGMSVFVGLIVSLGSSGLTNQIMSGFTLLYSRALRVGDFVKVGEIEGTVLQIGLLSTKIRTPVQEEVTVPNAVVIGASTTNYTRPHAGEGVFFTTTVTIGYDAPWRQVAGMLLAAASRTSGLRRTPPPRVQQTSLSDFYVEYLLMVCPENPSDKLRVMDALHANIQDEFNTHGVQIMSPHYRGDPAHAKIVPKDKWFTPPASQ